MDTVAECIRPLHLGCERGKGRAACFRLWSAREPLPKPYKVQRCGSRQVLQMGFDDAMTMPF